MTAYNKTTTGFSEADKKKKRKERVTQTPPQLFLRLKLFCGKYSLNNRCTVFPVIIPSVLGN